MTKLISILFFAMTISCAYKPIKHKPVLLPPAPHTYLKYSGYLNGCTTGMKHIILAMNTTLTPDVLNKPFFNAICMDLYLLKLEKENIKPPMKRLDINEAI